jgi:orotidine-5'-phosphate decarboxylase
MQNISDKLIVALDVDTLEKAKYFVDALYPTVKFFKIGIRLFNVCGPEVVKMIGKKGAKVFLDLKYHDIPNTVMAATATATNLNFETIRLSNTEGNITKNLEPAVFMMTVHIQGGRKMLEEAMRGATDKARELKIERPRIIGVTVLTSDEQEDTRSIVLERAKIAKEAGLDGVVCSVHEAAAVRKEFGRDFIIVTPGIRPKGYQADDQKRTATASDALAAGADYIVVGRPILEAKDPLKAVQELI